MKFTPLLDEFEAALSDGDLKRTEGALLAMNGTSQTVIELLNESKTLVANGRYDRAKTVANRLNDKYDTLSEQEQVLYRKALLAKYTRISTADRETLKKFHKISVQTQFDRSQVLMRLIALLSNPNSFDDDELRQNIADLTDAERKLQRTANDTETVVSETALPVSIEIISITPSQNPIKKGSSVTTRVRVENIGDEMATGIQVKSDSESELSITPNSITVGNLGATSDSTIEFEVIGDSAGTHTLSFEVDSENAGSSVQTATLNVQSSNNEPPALSGYDTPPKDLDDDGLYEDITGDGNLAFDDVVTLYQHRSDPVIQNNQGAFDFNGNGQFDFDDIVKLFEEVKAAG